MQASKNKIQFTSSEVSEDKQYSKIIMNKSRMDLLIINATILRIQSLMQTYAMNAYADNGTPTGIIASHKATTDDEQGQLIIIPDSPATPKKTVAQKIATKTLDKYPTTISNFKYRKSQHINYLNVL